MLPLSLTIETTSSQGEGNGKQYYQPLKVTNRGEAIFIDQFRVRSFERNMEEKSAKGLDELEAKAMQELIPLVPFSSGKAREGEKAGTVAHKTKYQFFASPHQVSGQL